MEQDVHDSMSRIDLELGGDLRLEIARFLEEANERLAVMLNLSRVVRRLADVVGHLHKPGIGKPLGARKLKHAVVDSRFDHEEHADPVQPPGSTWMRTF